MYICFNFNVTFLGCARYQYVIEINLNIFVN
jgi:hypothetical protein